VDPSFDLLVPSFKKVGGASFQSWLVDFPFLHTDLAASGSYQVCSSTYIRDRARELVGQG